MNKFMTGKRYFVFLCCLGAVAWTFMLFRDDDMSGWQASEDALAVADVSVHTPYVEEVAAALRQDPVFIDPLLADTVGRAVDTDGVRSALDASETPVHVIVVPTHEWRTKDDELLVARIADAADEDGAYLLFDETGRLADVSRGLDLGDHSLLLPYIHDEIFDEAAVRDAIAEVDEEVDRIHDASGGDTPFDSPFLLGVYLGVVFAVPLWYLMKFVRWSARRDRSYLKGFRQ